MILCLAMAGVAACSAGVRSEDGFIIPDTPRRGEPPPILAVGDAEHEVKYRMRVSAHGEMSASERFGTTCNAGFVPSEHSATFEVSSLTVVRVLATAIDRSDLTMVIEGPGGPYCNDDFEGRSPGVDRSFVSGIYRIYVGTWDWTGVRSARPADLTLISPARSESDSPALWRQAN